MSKFLRCCIYLGFCFSFNQLISSQEPVVNLFIDCPFGCDLTYFKTELTCVNFVNDRYQSNLYVMVAEQNMGSSGEKIWLYFNGSGFFEGMKDTLHTVRYDSESRDEYRKRLLETLKIGLVRYLYKAGKEDYLKVSLTANKDSVANNSTKQIKDKWDYWVFRIGLYGNGNIDDYVKSIYTNGDIGAYRVTEKYKFSFNSYLTLRQNSYSYDGEESTFQNNGKGFSGKVVAAINNHFSAGGFAGISSSSFANYKSNLNFTPAVEYSLFPYKDAVTRSVTLLYSAGPVYWIYTDTSYYGKLTDQNFMHNFSLNAGFNQKWGNLSMELSWQNFLNQFKLEGKSVRGWNVNSLTLYGNVELHIVKGLSLSTFGYLTYTQGIFPNIPQKNFTRDELLTNSKIYPAQISVNFYVSLNYQFGSIYNNVVNPRFNGTGN